MSKLFKILFTIFIGLTFSLGGLTDAEAKRLGGGGSFGGKSAFGSPYKRAAAQPVRSAKQQQASQQNQTARQNLSKRGGLMGMLGGLALGGLLGALLFGGAFENINFMDMLIFGGIAFLLYKLLRGRAGASLRPAYEAPQNSTIRHTAAPAISNPTAQRTGHSGFDSKSWFRNEPATPTGRTLEHEPVTTSVLPAGFDENTFLAGARNAYRDLQKAWDAHDLTAIRALTTDTMFSELQARTKDLARDNRTDVLKLNAELLDAREVGELLEAVVMFDAVLREDADAQAHQVREVWHFTREIASQEPKWYLDGIQQLED